MYCSYTLHVPFEKTILLSQPKTQRKTVSIYLNALNSLLLSALTSFTGVPLLVYVNVVFVLALVVECFALGDCFQYSTHAYNCNFSKKKLQFAVIRF